MQPPALTSMVTGVSGFHYSSESQERPGGAHEGSRLGWMQFQIGAEALVRRYRGDAEGLAEAMADFGSTTARVGSGEPLEVPPLRRLQDLPGSMMGDVVEAMSRPLDAPLYQRPWPSDTYERVRADSFHVGGWY